MRKIPIHPNCFTGVLVIGFGLLTSAIAQSLLSISTPASLPPATEGIAYTQQISVSDGVAPFRWSAGPGLPAGLALDAATGILRGTPSARGTYSFPVQVTDVSNASASKTFSLTVQPGLAITTVAPLFSGTVGSPYSQTFSAAGGLPPYSWTMRQTIPGLTFDSVAAVLAGTPEQPGAFTISVQVKDSVGTVVTKDFGLTIEQPQLRITNNASLPPGVVGVAYQQRFLAAGGQQPYTWSVVSGSIPGLVLDSATGILSNVPATAGAFTITVAVKDSAGATASRAFNITIAAGALKLAAPPDTLRNTIGEPFSISLSATGGTAPYSWSANGLPEGLEINAVSGVVSGTFRTVGNFLFTIRVTDAARATATELVSVDVLAPTLPSMTMPDLGEVVKTADQLGVRLQLASPYSLPLTGQLTLGFAPETGAGDPSVQFSTGGRTIDFRIPAGTTEAQFTTSPVGFQTGTVAGTISFTTQLASDGLNLTPTPVAIKTIRVDRAAPTITAATFTRSGSNIEIRITGYSPSREITQGVFRFQAGNGNTLAATELTVALDETFGRWFRDSTSTPFGSQFTFVQQFAIQGDINAVTPVSISLNNRIGSTTANIRQ